jgi:REP element-mobilizing transposase RayT
LPHWHPDGALFFVTWRLHGTLPYVARSHAPRSVLTQEPGPRWLTIPEVANSVSQVLRLSATDWELCDLRAWVIMPNHVHILLEPRRPLVRVLQSMKSASARLANRILARTGRPFWQDESFDHWVRNPDQERRIIRYIEGNPVSAGLTATPASWPWSSAAHDPDAPVKLS